MSEAEHRIPLEQGTPEYLVYAQYRINDNDPGHYVASESCRRAIAESRSSKMQPFHAFRGVPQGRAPSA